MIWNFKLTVIKAGERIVIKHPGLPDEGVILKVTGVIGSQDEEKIEVTTEQGKYITWHINSGWCIWHGKDRLKGLDIRHVREET